MARHASNASRPPRMRVSWAMAWPYAGLDAGFSAQGVHRDHVGLVKGAQHLVAPHVIIACRADERVEHADGADGNREVAHAGCRERLHAHAQHLGIGDEARTPDELDAELRELPLLAIVDARSVKTGSR